MATSVRPGASGGANGREKKVVTSSSSTSPLVRKSPRPSLSTPSEKTSSSMADRRQTPSYHRTSRSSKSLDTSSLSKRSPMESSSSGSSQTKPAPPRRRSFERPPTTSQVQKAVHGGGSVARETRPLRSTSFSARTSGSNRPAPQRSQSSIGKGSVRDGKKVESPLAKTRSLSRSTLAGKVTPKSSSRPGGLKKKRPKSLTSELSNECETNLVEHLVSDEDLGYIHNGVQSLPDMSEMPDSNEELRDPICLEVQDTCIGKEMDLIEEQKGIEEEDSMMTSHEKNLVDDHDLEKKPINDEVLNEKVGSNEIEETQEKEEEEEEEEEEEDKAAVEKQVEQESVNGEPTEVHQEKIQAKEGPRQEPPMEEEPIETSKEEEPAVKEAEKSEEKTEQEVEEREVVKSPSPQLTVSTLVRSSSQPGAKRENQAYNDVIEQTASKLMGKKNKVLALAGAFETVISLQDTNKN